MNTATTNAGAPPVNPVLKIIAGLGTPLIVVMMLAMIILPLPPVMLDVFFTFNISFSLIVLWRLFTPNGRSNSQLSPPYY